MNSEHYHVNGIGNESIKTSIKNSLEKIHGVNKVCVDIARGTVEVAYNSPATSDKIKKCIEDSGHEIE